MYELDVEEMELHKIETSGVKILPREGHGAVSIEEDILVIGGCNDGNEECYQNYHYFNVDSHWWEDKGDQS
jgi:hypothetical protein